MHISEEAVGRGHMFLSGGKGGWRHRIVGGGEQAQYPQPALICPPAPCHGYACLIYTAPLHTSFLLHAPHACSVSHASLPSTRSQSFTAGHRHSTLPTVTVRELAPPGELSNVKTLPFEFKAVEMQYDSYRGQAVSGWGVGRLCSFAV